MLFDLESVRLQEGFVRLEGVILETVTPHSVFFKTQAGKLEISGYAPGMIRLRLRRAADTDYGILAAQPQPVPLDVQHDEEGYHVRAGQLELVIHEQPLRISLKYGGRQVVTSSTDRTIQGDYRLAPVAVSKDEWLLSLGLQYDEAIFGLGEKFGGLNHRGELVTNWNRDATGVNAEISYKNTPFAWSPRGWGMYVHTAAKVTHGVGYAPWSHRSYVLRVHDPNLDVFFICGAAPAELLERFTWLTGRPPLPPRWSYGMWMSRAFYATAEELLEVADQLRKQEIPCDVLTLDGRAWHKSETRFDFSWDPDRYPEPEKFVAALLERNFRLCLWEYPYLSIQNPLFAELELKRFFLQTMDGQTYIHRWLPPPMDTYIPHLQPSGIIDFTNPEAYEWYRDMHKPLFESGVAVMKPDYGEAVPENIRGFNGDSGSRLHNVYALLYNRCVFEAAQMYGRSGALVWSRAAWTGSGRYPIQWGGDPQSDWDGLAGSIRGGLSWGMSGGAFYSHDIGGFYGSQSSGTILGTGKPDAELYLRWAQAGIMLSHCRFHGTSPREPWEFGDEAQAIIRRWLDWRYRLIPYLEACAAEAHASGMPVMRAMVLVFPQDPLSWGYETQYMLGPALLVAPVLLPGGEVSLYLPQGGWYDLWTGERIQGPCRLELKMPLDRMPMYGREGQTLLLGPTGQHTAEIEPDAPVESILFGQQPFILSI